MSPYDPIRNELHEYRVPVDKDALWVKTAHAIPGRRRRRPFLLWWSAGTVVLAAVGLILFTGGGRAVPMEKEVESVAMDGSFPDGSPARHSTPEAGRLLEEPGIASRTSEQESAKKSGQTMAEDPAGNVSGTPGSRHDGPELAIRTPKPAPGDGKELQEIISEETWTTETTARETSTEIESGMRIVQFPEIEALVPHPGLPVNDELSRTEVGPVGTSNGLVEPLECLSTQSILPIPEKIDLATVPEARWEVRKPHPRWFLTSAVGAGMASWHLKPLPGEEQEGASAWSRRFRTLEYLASSLQVGIQWPVRLETVLGIRYGRLVTEQDYTRTTAERIDGTGTSTVIIDETGGSESVTGDISYTRRTTTRSLRYNTHQILDLDLQLGFPLLRRGRLDVTGWIRGSLNAWHQVTGTRPDATWQPETIDPMRVPVNPSSRFNWGAGLEARWHVTPHAAMLLRTGSDGFRYRMDREETPLFFSHRLYSITLGVRYTP